MIYNDMRPHRFDDVKGQTLVVENIRNQSKKNRFFPVFILCGQYGSGKTTMARIIAMAANCKHKDANGNPCGECDSCRAVLDHSPEGITVLQTMEWRTSGGCWQMPVPLACSIRK